MAVLIASLGQNPYVITETLDHLRDNENMTFDRLFIVAPGELPVAKKVNEAGFLENGYDFSILKINEPNPGYPFHVDWSMDERIIETSNLPVLRELSQLDDIRHETDALCFYQAILGITGMYCYSEDVHYAIAGGRKSMSSLMVLAAQVLPVKGIYQILLKDTVRIKNNFALKLRADDDTLLEYLLDIAESGGDSSDAKDLHDAFHPGSNTTELIEIEFRQSFEENVVRSVSAQLQKGRMNGFDDVKKAIYRYFENNSHLQPPPCKNQKIDESPKRIDHEQSTLTSDERRKTIATVRRLMKAIPQICEVEHHFGIRKAKDKSNNLHCYDAWIHPGKNTSRFETMFPVDSSLRVRLHFITTAKNQAQMNFVWHKIEKFCDDPSNPAPAVLISTLGESPGIVTSAVHFYEKSGMKFDKIVVVAPDNETIRRNCREGILKLQNCLKNRMQYKTFAAPDVRNQKEIEIFLEKMKETVIEYVNKGYRIYLNLSGGRKAMSGVLLLLAQLYHMEKAFHLSILDSDLDRDIEKYGEWKGLEELKCKGNRDGMRRYNQILYPDMEKTKALEFVVSRHAKIGV